MAPSGKPRTAWRQPTQPTAAQAIGAEGRRVYSPHGHCQNAPVPAGPPLADEPRAIARRWSLHRGPHANFRNTHFIYPHAGGFLHWGEYWSEVSANWEMSLKCTLPEVPCCIANHGNATFQLKQEAAVAGFPLGAMYLRTLRIRLRIPNYRRSI